MQLSTFCHIYNNRNFPKLSEHLYGCLNTFLTKKWKIDIFIIFRQMNDNCSPEFNAKITQSSKAINLISRISKLEDYKLKSLCLHNDSESSKI